MYDVIIIGAGPSGLTCALYCHRAGKKVLIIEKGMVGGQVALTTNIENFPSIKKIDGVNLAIQMYEQVQSLGIEFKFEEVFSCSLKEKIKTVVTNVSSYESKTVYICTGASSRQLNAEGEKKFISKGVSYCATCDGALYKNKDVAIVGGGNTALEDCLYLSNIVNKVYLIHRRDVFRGDDILVKRIHECAKKGKVERIMSSEVVKINGDDKVKEIEVKNKIENKIKKIPVSALFVAVGRKPDTEIFEDLNLSNSGYILTDNKMKTNIEGVFAGGDVRDTILRQIITACADGAIASVSINEYLSK